MIDLIYLPEKQKKATFFVVLRMDEWMDGLRDFTSFLTVFQSY